MIKSRAKTKMRIAKGANLKVTTGVGSAVANGATGARTAQAAAAARTSATR